MSIKRVVPDLDTDRMDERREFYIQAFGFEVTMDLGWLVTLASPDNPTAQINLLRRTGSSDSQNAPDLTIEVTDVDPVHDIASTHRRGRASLLVYTVRPRVDGQQCLTSLTSPRTPCATGSGRGAIGDFIRGATPRMARLSDRRE